MATYIPLDKLSCHHCKLWHKSCSGIQYKNLWITGNTYCLWVFQNYSEQSVDGKEFSWDLDTPSPTDLPIQ